MPHAVLHTCREQTRRACIRSAEIGKRNPESTVFVLAINLKLLYNFVYSE